MILTASIASVAVAGPLGLREPRLSVAKWRVSCGPADETGNNSKCVVALDTSSSSAGLSVTTGTASSGNSAAYACFRGFPSSSSSAMLENGRDAGYYDLRPSQATLAATGCPSGTQIIVTAGAGVDSTSSHLIWVMSDRTLDAG